MNLGAISRPAAAPADSRRTIPFDYQFRLEIRDKKDPERSVVSEQFTAAVTVSVEAAFVAVSIGYGLVPFLRTFTFGPSEVEDTEIVAPNPPPPLPQLLAFQPGPLLANILRQRRTPAGDEAQLFGQANTVAARRAIFAARVQAEPALAGLLNNRLPRRIMFGEIINSLGRALGEGNFSLLGEIGPRTAQVLQQGIRVNPAFLKTFLALNGQVDLSAEATRELFQASAPAPQDIQFLYALHDKGSGRSFQSSPLLNTAGLGIADGDRPFRYFATPIVFPPRSTIQLDITPQTDFKGELHVVLHGYKVLGGQGTPTGRQLRRGARQHRRRR